MRDRSIGITPVLPDPGPDFMLAMRHGSVELALMLKPHALHDDATFLACAQQLRDAVLREVSRLTDPTSTKEP
jgi:hypothetical protein